MHLQFYLLSWRYKLLHIQVLLCFRWTDLLHICDWLGNKLMLGRKNIFGSEIDKSLIHTDKLCVGGLIRFDWQQKDHFCFSHLWIQIFPTDVWTKLT